MSPGVRVKDKHWRPKHAPINRGTIVSPLLDWGFVDVLWDDSGTSRILLESLRPLCNCSHCQPEGTK